MDLWHSLGGMVQVSLTSADPAAALTAIHASGIVLYEAVSTDEMTLRFRLSRRSYPALQRVASRRGEKLELVGRRGLYWAARAMLKRPVLLVGIALILLLGFYLPTRVLFIQVEGNGSVPAKRILEAAQTCGIRFGASRQAVRSEQMKNALLQAIPELQWAGINTKGCVATISVRERQAAEDTEKSGAGVSSIVAVCDGVIQSCTVTRGTAACKVGQAVSAGQVLISGYTDCGISILATRAEGEVYALTRHFFTAVTPTEWQIRGEQTVTVKKYSLIFGKKRINFYKGSGILDGTCAKMYTEDYLTLPGGFQLPIAIVTEEWVYYSESAQATQEADASALLSGFADTYLRSQMVAGRILSGTESTASDAGVMVLEGEYSCLEMIGQERSEEIIEPYE
ncbi:MAG: sporulation protein YqfD [Firmicutes bacterium]|nr:sporulation protein YqfD [Bacillota bacterium]